MLKGALGTVTFASPQRFKRDSLQLHTAATGFAGISTDAALPLYLAASVLSRVSLSHLSLAVQLFCCLSWRQRSALLRSAGPTVSRAGAGRHRATSPRGQVSSATSPCERWIQFLSDAIWCFNGSNRSSRWPDRGTLIFRHDTGRQFWSGCISLHQALIGGTSKCAAAGPDSRRAFRRRLAVRGR